MKMPLLTVIITVYNSEKSILLTLDSIKHQSYTNLQVIIVDDGSKDNTLKIIQDYANSDNRFIVFNKINGGVSSARNLGLELAVGEYIIFSDSDDIVLPKAYEMLMNEAIQSLCDIVVGDFIKGTKISYEKKSNNIEIENNELFISNLLRGKTHGGMWNKLIRAELLKSNKFVEGINFMEDMLLLIKILLINNVKIKVINNVVYHYIDNENSYTNNISNNYLDMGDKVVSILSSLLKNNNEDLKYLQFNQKLLYLLNCNTYELSIREIYPEINPFIRKMNIPLKYKILVMLENKGFKIFTKLFKQLKKIKHDT